LQYVTVCDLGECVAGKAFCVAGEALAVVAALTASAEGQTKHQQTSKEIYTTSTYVKRDLYTSKETYKRDPLTATNAVCCSVLQCADQ